jgi:hypothetical protein
VLEPASPRRPASTPVPEPGTTKPPSQAPRWSTNFPARPSSEPVTARSRQASSPQVRSSATLSPSSPALLRTVARQCAGLTARAPTRTSTCSPAPCSSSPRSCASPRHAMSPRSLQRLFRRYVGVSPKWVLRRYQLHEAAERIAEGRDGGAAATAPELGYFDQAHFVRDFKDARRLLHGAARRRGCSAFRLARRSRIVRPVAAREVTRCRRYGRPRRRAPGGCSRAGRAAGRRRRRTPARPGAPRAALRALRGPRRGRRSGAAPWRRA